MEFLAKVENRGAYKDLIDFNKNLYSEIIEKLKTVEDPEISMDVYNLGLIYNILGDLNNNIIVVMTLTTPACPMASMLIKNIVSEVEKVPEVNNVDADIVFEPKWTIDSMSDYAKVALGLKE